MARLLGFLSYAKVNDAQTDGRVSELRVVLEAEVRNHGVQDFDLFQDVDTAGGAEWERGILEKVDAAVLFVPIVTPTFFTRPWCQRETDRFLARPAVASGRAIVYPLYFIHDPEFEDEDWRADDHRRVALHRYQFRDVRPHRVPGYREGAGRAALAECGKELALQLILLRKQEEAWARAAVHLAGRRFAEAARELRRGRLAEAAAACVQVDALVGQGEWHRAAELALAQAALHEAWGPLAADLRREAEEAAARQRAEAARKAEEARKAPPRPGTLLHTAFPDVAPLRLVWIPAGTFRMGSPDGFGFDGERPRHPVRITRPFLAGVTPVTQAQWRAVAKAAGLPESPSRLKGDTHPVERVSWFDAARWCNALSAAEGRPSAYTIGAGDDPEVKVDLAAPGYRVPTEAEWEYLCRAGTETRWSFGDDEAALGEYAWFGGNAGDTTHPVGEKRPNPWGLYDVHGNVWEWCGDGKRAYMNQPVDDPFLPPAVGVGRVVRGGSWINGPGWCRSACRGLGYPVGRGRNLGFRVVLPLPRGL